MTLRPVDTLPAIGTGLPGLSAPQPSFRVCIDDSDESIVIPGDEVKFKTDAVERGNLYTEGNFSIQEPQNLPPQLLPSKQPIRGSWIWVDAPLQPPKDHSKKTFRSDPNHALAPLQPIPTRSTTHHSSMLRDHTNRPSSSMLASPPVVALLDQERPRTSLSSFRRWTRSNTYGLPERGIVLRHQKTASPCNPRINPLTGSSCVRPREPIASTLDRSTSESATDAGGDRTSQLSEQSNVAQKGSDSCRSTELFPDDMVIDPSTQLLAPMKPLDLPPPATQPAGPAPPEPSISYPCHPEPRYLEAQSPMIRGTRHRRRRERIRPLRPLSGDSADADDEKIDNTSNVQRTRVTMRITEEDNLMARISAMLDRKESYRPALASLGTSGLAQEMIDYCQSVLDDRVILESAFGRKILVFMQRLSKTANVVPELYDLALSINVADADWVTAGRFGDVYRSWCNGQVVCVKKIRPVGLNAEDEKLRKLRKQLAHEGIFWWQLKHPNVLPFYGVCLHNVLPCLISPWMEHGDINTYLRNHPNVDRYLLVNDVLKGLDYLHQRDLIHGDLKGANVLVDSWGHALLADFGISSVFDEKIPKWDSHPTVASRGGTRRWQAPELFDPTEGDKEPYNTAESDVYAWACICYEVFTGRLPFWEVTKCELVILTIMEGKKPTYPYRDDDAWQKWGLKDEFWFGVMDKCWARQPSERPSIRKLLSKLRHLVAYDDRPLPRTYESPAKYQVQRHQKSPLESLRIIDYVLSAMHTK